MTDTMTTNRKPGRPAAVRAAPADMPEILPAVAERIEAAQDAALSVAETDEVFAAGLDVGRLEALDFVLTVGTSAIVSVFENVKKSKAWRHLRNPNSSHGEKFESLEQFCEVKLGKSYKRLQAISSNRAAIGAEAFEQAERIGLRQVDYNAIKTLPAPDQELVRRAVEESQSRDEVLGLLQELAARHGQKERALNRQIDDLKADADATRRLLGARDERILLLERESQLIAQMPPDKAQEEIKEKALQRMNAALADIRGGVRQALVALDADGAGVDNTVFMAGLVGQLAAELAALRAEFNLPDLSSAAERQLAAEVAEWAPRAQAAS